ncbi:hypothetical protein ACLQ24_01850 [Micromonospora sp. DT4]|uniref:hypothetical protein n=1 Tax=Micromonospora sp. DT4 TaxID=3393438 RepID=UPI003CE869B0
MSGGAGDPHVTELLTPYYLDVLDRVEGSLVTAHLGDCADCRDAAEAVIETIAVLALLPEKDREELLDNFGALNRTGPPPARFVEFLAHQPEPEPTPGLRRRLRDRAGPMASKAARSRAASPEAAASLAADIAEAGRSGAGGFGAGRSGAGRFDSHLPEPQPPDPVDPTPVTQPLVARPLTTSPPAPERTTSASAAAPPVASPAARLPSVLPSVLPSASPSVLPSSAPVATKPVGQQAAAPSAAGPPPPAAAPAAPAPAPAAPAPAPAPAAPASASDASAPAVPVPAPAPAVPVRDGSARASDPVPRVAPGPAARLSGMPGSTRQSSSEALSSEPIVPTAERPGPTRSAGPEEPALGSAGPLRTQRQPVAAVSTAPAVVRNDRSRPGGEAHAERRGVPRRRRRGAVVRAGLMLTTVLAVAGLAIGALVQHVDRIAPPLAGTVTAVAADSATGASLSVVATRQGDGVEVRAAVDGLRKGTGYRLMAATSDGHVWRVLSWEADDTTQNVSGRLAVPLESVASFTVARAGGGAVVTADVPPRR